MELDLREEYYTNIIKESLSLDKEAGFIAGGLTEEQILGIKHFTNSIGLSETEKDIVALRYSEEMTIKEIADALSIKESFVSGALSQFRKEVIYSPYRLYIVRGLKEGDDHKDAVLKLFKDRLSHDGYEDRMLDINRLDVIYLGYLGFDTNLVCKLLKEEIHNVGELINIIKSGKGLPKTTRREAETINNFIKKYHLI